MYLATSCKEALLHTLSKKTCILFAYLPCLFMIKNNLVSILVCFISWKGVGKINFKQYKDCTFLKAYMDHPLICLSKNQKELFLTNIKYSPNPTFFSLSNVPNFNLGFEIFVDTYLIDCFDRICLVNKVNIFLELILLLVA